MAYCTQTDLERRIGSALLIELTDDSGSGSVNANVLNDCISDSDGVIDGYLRGQYYIPLSPVPDMIRRVATYVVVYFLYDRRASAFGGIPAHVDANYKWANELLKSVREGTVDLGIEPPPTVSSAQVAQTDGPDRAFTATTLMDF